MVVKYELSLLTYAARTFWPVFGAFWLIGGVMVLLIGAVTVWSNSHFKRQAIVVEGRVIERTSQESRGPRGASSVIRTVTYRFAGLEGREITGRQKVGARTWNALAEGTRVQIAYLPTDPARNRLADVGDWRRTPLIFTLGVAAVAFGSVLVWRGVTGCRREQRLAREGTPARATVTAVKELWHRDPQRRPRQVAYHYQDHHGHPHQGLSMTLLPEMVEGLRIGDVREVRYDPHNPADSLWLGNEISDEQR